MIHDSVIDSIVPSIFIYITIDIRQNPRRSHVRKTFLLLQVGTYHPISIYLPTTTPNTSIFTHLLSNTHTLIKHPVPHTYNTPNTPNTSIFTLTCYPIPTPLSNTHIRILTQYPNPAQYPIHTPSTLPTPFPISSPSPIPTPCLTGLRSLLGNTNRQKTAYLLPLTSVCSFVCHTVYRTKGTFRWFYVLVRHITFPQIIISTLPQPMLWKEVWLAAKGFFWYGIWWCLTLFFPRMRFLVTQERGFYEKDFSVVSMRRLIRLS